MEKYDDDYGLVHQLREFRLAQEAEKRGDSGSEKYHNMIARLAANLEKNCRARLTTPAAARSEKK